MTAPRRRWFRFSLRTLFVLVTLFAVWLAWQLNLIHQRNAMHRWIEAHGGSAATGSLGKSFRDEIIQAVGPDPDFIRQFAPETRTGTIPWFKTILGDHAVAYIVIPRVFDPGHVYKRAQVLFPEALIIPVPLDERLTGTSLDFHAQDWTNAAEDD
jgi:hypothetical protein